MKISENMLFLAAFLEKPVKLNTMLKGLIRFPKIATPKSFRISRASVDSVQNSLISKCVGAHF